MLVVEFLPSPNAARSVEWPGPSPRGCAYVTFESERRVRALLAASRRDGHDWYYRITSRKMRSKEVRVALPSPNAAARNGSELLSIV